MPAILEKPQCTHREEHPIKECSRCGAYLRSYGNEAFCDPCTKGPVDPDDTFAVIQVISSMRDIERRREAFDALAEIQAA